MAGRHGRPPPPPAAHAARRSRRPPPTPPAAHAARHPCAPHPPPPPPAPSQLESARDSHDAAADRLARRVLHSEQLARHARLVEVESALDALSIGASRVLVLEADATAIAGPRVVDDRPLRKAEERRSAPATRRLGEGVGDLLRAAGWDHGWDARGVAASGVTLGKETLGEMAGGGAFAGLLRESLKDSIAEGGPDSD